MTHRALVTGAAREGGIGRAIVRRLEADGLEVVTADREPGCTWCLDLARDELPHFGAVDVYVGNAAITSLVGAAHTFDLDKWRLDLEVNLTGTFRVLQACLSGMRERGYGRIVLISSTAATQGMPAQVSYATSKAGLLVRCRHVPQEIQQAWLRSLPNGFVDPADIANAVAFFASPAAGMVTGQELTVDGGDWLNLRSVTPSVVDPA